ncbi:MAG: DUF4097 family beta strand repeat protein [Acidobacteriaceae bacterium]|nr:DUF4097 family beta strand repeat protein [Acidobacteriaceae bacterium]
MRRLNVFPISALVALSIYAVQANAGAFNDGEGCSANRGWGDDRAHYAESREQRLATAPVNSINPGQNGSVRVHGWNSGDVLVKACIQTGAPTEAEAQELAREVKIAKGPGQIEASGPEAENHRYWSVSYEVWLPGSSNLNLKAFNGSIAVEAVHGQIRFETLNGSVRLNGVGGDVDGSTTNGSLNVDLATSAPTSGIRLSTTNGSVRLRIPENFSARVEASTVNGSVHTDFPITVSGDIGKHLSFTVGSGGPLVETSSVNGSVHISRGA